MSLHTMPDIRHACWDNACPMGVSYIDHLRSLQLAMVQLYFFCGGKGVLVAHPMVVSLLAVSEPSTFGKFKWSPEWRADDKAQSMAGRVGGIELWSDPAVRGDEVLVVSGPNDFQPLGRLQIVNFVEVPEPLDRLAQI